MTDKDKGELYLIRWDNGEEQVTDYFNIETLRHYETKNGDKAQFAILRKVTEEDKVRCGINGHPYEKKRLFVDMDGTLAEWKYAKCFEQLLEEGYFRTLRAHKSVVDAVRIIIKTRSDISIRSLSAYLTENVYAVKEKNEWLDENLPEITDNRRNFCVCGTSKSEYIRSNTGYFGEGDFLLDDYSHNLHQWVADGGVGIKLMNGINGTNGTWTGPSVGMFCDAEELADKILEYIDGKAA